MKKLASFIVATLVFCTFVSAQSPQAIPFQAIVRDTNNVILPNQGMAIRIDILSGSPTGTLLYQEIQSATTNSLGLLNLSIGQGAAQTGTMTGINWGSGPIYVEIEVDLSGGSNFTELGVTQLQSVPYALYALNGGGSTAQPSGQITYGSGSGVTSDGGFTRNPVTQQTIITDNFGSQGATKMRVDSTKILISYSDYASGDASGFFSGPAYPDWNLNSICVASVVYDQANQIKYGYYAVADSTQMVTGATIGGAVVGTKLYSAYMDVAMVENPNSPFNSLTVDTNGLHWEYGDTDRFTFPNADGAPGQVMTTNGSGILSWTTASGGAGTQPSGQVTYGTGTGVTSDGGFTRDPASQKTIISDNFGSQGTTMLRVDSAKLFMTYSDNATGNSSGVFTGPSFPDLGLNSICVSSIVYDQNNNIIFGFWAVQDSSQIQTGGTEGGAIVGTKLYSAYMDVAMYENPNSPFNSLTVDTNGLHWEYGDTDRFTFPNIDGAPGQVMTTDGAGHLSWGTVGGGSTPWTINDSTVVLSDSAEFVGIGTTNPSYNLHVLGTVGLGAVGQQQTNAFFLDTNSVRLLNLQADGIRNVVSVGNPGSSSPAGSVSVLGLDYNNSIRYGFWAVRDSVQFIASDINGNDGIAGAKDSTVFLDVSYNGGQSLNSLTVDGAGVHWEYNDTDRYTLPVTDGAAGQVMTTDGAGHIGWTSVGGGATPWTITDSAVVLSNPTQFVGVGTSNPSYNFEALGTVGLAAIGQQQTNALLLDTNSLELVNHQGANGIMNVVCVGGMPGSSFPGGSIGVLGLDYNNSIRYGFWSVSDSTQFIASDTHGNDGIAGAKDSTVFLDVSYNGGESLNSLTIDDAGAHWEYNDTDRYTLPLSDGAAGQVMTTNGSGILSWTNPVSGPTWAINDSTVILSDTNKLVGIGTATPVYNLQVIGTVGFQSATTLTSNLLTMDTNSLLLTSNNLTTGLKNAVGVGGVSGSGFPGGSVVCVGVDNTNNIQYGFWAASDSTQLVASDNAGNNGIAGAKDSTVFLDVSYNAGASLNSLTVDNVGVHWEYNDTDRYTFPMTDGAASQVLSTDGSGHLAWVTGGSAAQPSNQIAYGTGTGVTSDGGFTRDATSQKTVVSDNFGSQGSTMLRVDSTKIFMTYADNASGDASGFFSGPAYPDWNLNSICVASVVYDQANQIKYGYYAVADSTQMVTGATIGGAVVGTKLYSAYMDVAMVENPNSPFNSLTVDTNGLHWEYNDTDRYTFPITDGAPSQVLSTDGSGHLAWVTGGSAAQPSNQIAYGTGTGVTSDGGFTRDATSQKTVVSDNFGSQGSTMLRVDSTKIFMTYADNTSGSSAGFFCGPAFPDWQLNSICVASVVYDQANQIQYGYYAVADSSQMITGGTVGGAVVGTKLYSAYLDVAMVENPNSPFNSLTVDTNGLHWEYNDTDRYSFPNTDGAPGQVLTTNGAGVLTFTTIPTTAWNGHQIITASGNASDTISLLNNKNNIYNATSSVSSLLVNLPGSPNDGDMFVLTLNATVTGITFQNGTVAPASANVATASQQKTYTYDAATTSWY